MSEDEGGRRSGRMRTSDIRRVSGTDRRGRVALMAKRFWRHAVLLVVGALVVYPFYYMLVTSVKPLHEATAIPPTFLPNEYRFENYAEAWEMANWARYFANTVFVAGVVTLAELVTSVLAAYAFARMKFRWSAILFAVLLATYMMPGEAVLIPNFVIMSRRFLNLYDTYWAQILPFVASAFSIFLLRQQFRSVPQELHDAAKIDGAGHLRFLWSIVLPISVPVLVTVSILSFYGSWNAFQWPLIITSDPDIRPIQVGLNAFRSESGTQYHLLMAASAFVTAPVVLLYLLGQRYLVQGVARTGIRG